MLKLNIPPQERKVFTVSNMITLSRLLLLPILLYLVRQPRTFQNDLGIAILATWGIVSDFLDGYIARKRNEVSVLGKILDPLTDKICIGTTVIFAWLYRGMPFWIVAVIIGRDLLIILASIYIIVEKRFVSVSNIYGKLTVTIMALLVVSYLFEITFLQKPLTYLAILGIIVSLATYGWGFIVTIRAS